jgi:ABC-2 type transport system ATP-binding protein
LPESILTSVTGQVWELVVPSADLPALRQRYPISSTAHRSDGVHVRIVSPMPPAMPGARDARPLEPSLEDAYLAVLGSQRNSAAAAGTPRAAGVVA